MGNKHSSSRPPSEDTRRQSQQQQQPEDPLRPGAQRSGGRVSANSTRPTRGGATPSNMPPHLANQYSNNTRQQRTGSQPTSPQGNAAPRPPPPQQPPPPSQQQQTPQQQQSNDRGVQEGQMVKMLATIEASTVSYNASAKLLSFFITSICPCLTYEIHTGVKEFVEDGNVFYMPNRPKMEPTRTVVEGPQSNRRITVKMDLSRLDEKELAFNKHYPKQMPCVIVIRYRTTELRRKDGGGAPNGDSNNDAGEEVVVEHTEHTAVDLSEKPRRRVISQIVTAGGSAYVVENLFGADNEGGAAGGDGTEVMVGSTIAPHDGEDDEDGLCVICLTNPKDTAVMPCRHMCMCKECGEQLLKHKPVCPVCRAPISTLLHMPRGK